MRKLVLTLLLATSFTGLFAQKLDEVKEKLEKQKYGEAKEKIDKVLADPKNQNVSDAWFYKAKTYYGLSKTDPNALPEALSAMKKYLELEQGKEEKTRMVLSTFDNNGTFFNIYSDYFKGGVKNFQDKKYNEALTSFKSALEAFDLLSKYKLTDVKFDTTATIYAGFAAQNAEKYDDAARYYDMMVSQKINDTIYVDAYRFLINYNLEQKKDTANAIKYLSISEATYPKYEDMWLDYEMLLMSHNSRPAKIARYQELVQKYPSNFLVNLNYAVELYNNTFFSDSKSASYPADQEASRKALEKAVSLDPSSAHANFIMSQFYVNQIYDIDDSLRAIKGTAAADLAKKKDMNARMDQKYESMFQYSQKAYDLYAANEASLKTPDRTNYRKVANQLSDYYNKKKQMDKAKQYEDKAKSIKLG